MKLPSNLSTVFAFGLVAATLAVVAAVLPAKRVDQNDKLAFEIEYTDPLESVDIPTDPETTENNLVEDLIAELTPKNVPIPLDHSNGRTGSRPIARATTPRDELIEPIEIEMSELPIFEDEDEIATSKLVRVETSSVVVTSSEDGSIAAKEKADADETMRASAITASDLSQCDGISSERTADECRNAIYFKQAVAERNLAKCDSITSTSSKVSCQNYVSLMLKNAN